MQSHLKSHPLFCGYGQIDSKVHMERQKTQESEHTTGEQSGKIDATQLQELLYSHGNQVLPKEQINRSVGENR